ncbi:MAG: DUF2793 domain-containing protein [Pseudomonadota bacterium]
MSSLSARMGLPYIQPNQAQKYLTHNEALRLLDNAVQLSVITTEQVSPPSTPTDGDCYIVPEAAQGDWAGHGGDVAVWEGTYWHFTTPQVGWLAWDRAAQVIIAFTGTAWAPASATVDHLSHLGVNAHADDTNRLIVASDATLLTHATGGGHQVKINKQSSDHTASLLFQTQYTGHAEIGISGSNELAIKVSADGADWKTALSVNAHTGIVDFPFGATVPGPMASVRHQQSSHIMPLSGDQYPSDFAHDAGVTGDVPLAYAYQGYGGDPVVAADFIPVDPQSVYRVETYIRQQSALGDFGAYDQGDRHQHTVGLACYDADFNLIASGYKPCCLNATSLPSSDQWYHARHYIGGVDGAASQGFAPGTCYVKPYWQPNASNQPGGANGYPDTGNQTVWFAGLSVLREPLAVVAGAGDVHVPQPDIATGTLSLIPAQRALRPIG